MTIHNITEFPPMLGGLPEDPEGTCLSAVLCDDNSARIITPDPAHIGNDAHLHARNVNMNLKVLKDALSTKPRNAPFRDEQDGKWITRRVWIRKGTQLSPAMIWRYHQDQLGELQRRLAMATGEDFGEPRQAVTNQDIEVIDHDLYLQGRCVAEKPLLSVHNLYLGQGRIFGRRFDLNRWRTDLSCRLADNGELDTTTGSYQISRSRTEEIYDELASAHHTLMSSSVRPVDQGVQCVFHSVFGKHATLTISPDNANTLAQRLSRCVSAQHLTEVTVEFEGQDRQMNLVMLPSGLMLNDPTTAPLMLTHSGVPAFPDVPTLLRKATGVL